jgi:hypothetical protein
MQRLHRGLPGSAVTRGLLRAVGASHPVRLPDRTRAWCALQGIVGSRVPVQPWSSPERHVAGAQGSWVTAGAEAASPAGQAGHRSRPPPPVPPAASGGEPARDTSVPSRSRQAQARAGVKTPETPPRSTLRRRGRGRRRQATGAHGRSQAVRGPQPLRAVGEGRAAVPGAAVCDVGGGHRTVAPRDRSPRGAGRTAAATGRSAGGSDAAGPTGPTPSAGPLPTTPAHAIPGGQAAQASPRPGARRPHLPACSAVAGLAGRPSPGGQGRRRRGPARRRRAAGRCRRAPGARARPPGWARPAAAGAAGRSPHPGRPAKTAGEADRPGSGGATGGDDRARAARGSHLPTPRGRRSPTASGHPRGAGRPRPTRLAWGRGRSRARRRR